MSDIGHFLSCSSQLKKRDEQTAERTDEQTDKQMEKRTDELTDEWQRQFIAAKNGEKIES